MATAGIYTPVDMGSIKKKLQDVTAVSKTKRLIWKPVVGEQGSVIRIVPYKHGPDPFNILFFHYELGTNSALCAATFGKPCPLCEFADTLRANKSKEGYAAFKKISSKRRVYIPIIVRGKEEEGVKFWGVSKTVYERLLTLYNDPEYGDMSHPTEGTDITVQYTGPDSKMIFGKTEIFPKRNKSRLFEDNQKIVAVLNSVPNIYEIYPEQSYSDLQKALDTYLKPKAEEGQESSNSFSAGDTLPDTSVDDQFDELFSTKTK